MLAEALRRIDLELLELKPVEDTGDLTFILFGDVESPDVELKARGCLTILLLHFYREL